MYFLRVDYLSSGHNGVQRSRDLCKSLSAVLRILRFLRDSRVTILQVKLELCV